MGAFFANESSFSNRYGLLGDRIWRKTHLGVGPASLVGTRRLGVTEKPAVALSRRRSRSGATGSLSCAPSLTAASGKRFRRRGYSVAKPGCSPEAQALPGGGPVRGHTPNSPTRDVASVPSDRSGGLGAVQAAWPPRAAKGNAGDSGRILRDELRTSGSAGFTNSSP